MADNAGFRLLSGGELDRLIKSGFFYIFGDSDAAWRTGQGGLKKPADAFRMAGSGFRENALRVLARRRVAACAEILSRSAGDRGPDPANVRLRESGRWFREKIVLE